MRLAAYQPDIPQNVGALMRLCAGFDVSLDLIEPFGFPWDARKVRQSALDYYDLVDLKRHSSWDAFNGARQGRVILLSTKAALPYTEFKFEASDILLLGRESAGVPEDVHQAADQRVFIPMSGKIRSFNMAMSGAIVLAEARRQLCVF